MLSITQNIQHHRIKRFRDNKQFIIKDTEISNCGLMTQQKHEIFKDRKYPHQDSSWAPPKYKSEALLLNASDSVFTQRQITGCLYFCIALSSNITKILILKLCSGLFVVPVYFRIVQLPLPRRQYAQYIYLFICISIWYNKNVSRVFARII